MSEETPKRIARSDLLRTSAAAVGGITLLGLLAGGCASEKLIGQDGPPKTDPDLIKYRETSRFKPGFHWLRGLCTDGSSVWVAGDMEVREFSADGSHARSLTMPGTAKCVACDPAGELFAATDDQVVHLSVSSAWQSLGPRARIVAIAADRQNVFIADAGNRSVLRCDKSGHVISRFGQKTADYPGLIVPSPFIGLAIHPSGDLLLTNLGLHRVERHTIEGRLVEAVGEQGMGMDAFCGCCNPTHVSALPNGDMVTSEKGLPRVKVISPDGALRCVVAGPEQFHAETLGLATAVMGNRILVLDPWEGVIRVYSPV
jgi:hypothetical protein